MFDEDNGFSTSALKISYMGVIDYATGKEMDFWEKDMKKLLPVMEKADMIVGYNIFSFDMPVIANYLGQQVNQLPMLDLMVAMKRKIGFRPKLDALCVATLGRGKIGSGLDAIRYYKEKKFDDLKKYCRIVI